MVLKQHILTQFLYSKDEVEYMIVYCLLQQSEWKELLFWINEYYISGYTIELWQLLFKIYYDFYATTNPTFESYLFRKFKKWENKTTKNNTLSLFIDIIKNVRLCNHTNNVFNLRMKLQTNPLLKGKRGRRPNWLKQFDDTYKKFVYALHTHNEEAIIYFCNHIEEYDALYEHALLYYKQASTVKICKRKIKKIKKCKEIKKQAMKKLTTKTYNLNTHILLALYAHMNADSKHVTIQKKYIKHSNSDLQIIKSFWLINTPYTYKFLEKVCLYNIHPSCGAFKLSRFQFKEYKKEIWYHWENYAYSAPLWKQRYEKFNATLHGDEKKVRFKNDDSFEDFYELYYLEPDEQKQVVQDTFIGDIGICKDGLNMFNALMWGKTNNITLVDTKHRYVY